MSAESEFCLHDGLAVDDNAHEAWCLRMPELDEDSQLYV
jgi:hypothetical protein